MSLDHLLKDFQADPNLLRERTVLVTGATGGFGSAISRAAAKAGATVILLAKNLRKLEGLYDQIEAEGGPQPAIYPMNLEGATEADYESLRQTLEKEFGQIHALVHAAASLGQAAPFALQDVESWYQTLQINLNARFLLTRATLPLMKNSENAQIVFINDEKHTAYWGAYGVSGWACDGMMKMLAAELEGGPIFANSVHPSPTKTAMRLRAYPGSAINTDLPTADQHQDIFLYLLSGQHALNGEILALPAISPT